MENKALQEKIGKLFTNYLKQKGGRCTPERFKILESVLGLSGHFTVEELQEQMERNKFHVSRATLYNTMNELLEAQIVVRHEFDVQIRFELSVGKPVHHHQICKVCGKVKEFQSADLDAAVHKLQLKRFTMQSYSMCVYGICSTCLAQQRKEEKIKNKIVKNGNES